MTKEERILFLRACSVKKRREYYGKVAGIGCLICGNNTDIHHCYGNQFPAKREHRPVIPLCHKHHQGDGGIHDGKESFENYYGTQDELLLKTEAYLNGKETA